MDSFFAINFLIAISLYTIIKYRQKYIKRTQKGSECITNKNYEHLVAFSDFRDNSEVICCRKMQTFPFSR